MTTTSNLHISHSRQENFRAFGYNAAVGTGFEGIINSSVNAHLPSVGEAIEIVSGSTLDAFANTRAKQVKLYGLDGDYEPQTEVINMNGTTPVVSPLVWTRVYKVVVIASGSISVSNAGLITVRKQSAGATYLTIDINEGVSQSAHFVTGSKQHLYIRRIVFYADLGDAVTFRMFKRTDIKALSGVGVGNVKETLILLPPILGLFTLDYPNFLHIEPHTDVLIEGKSGTASSASVEFCGILASDQL